MAMNNEENVMYVPYLSILKMQENGLSTVPFAVASEIVRVDGALIFTVTAPVPSGN